MSGEVPDKEEKKKLIERGLGIAKAAIDAQPDNALCHKWYGILLGTMGDFLATKEKIANAYVVRDHFKRATELLPNDGTCQHCMGKWCWSILQIGWLERQAASLLFGTPPTSSYDECAGYLLAAAKLDPTMTTR